MFHVGVDPANIEAMPVDRLVYWHQRAVAWQKRKNEAERQAAERMKR